ncbi:pyridoxal phosphate-dependent aminotransferase [Fodinicurvata sp. EGI_FJ10296]|uniref:pyridoxal phosphate-dependent aminotransferase n=1 Tax=Fodinicurvata sp. EGI_FJ10296 TaxID=3231908 RepID=UPI003452E929
MSASTPSPDSHPGSALSAVRQPILDLPKSGILDVVDYARGRDDILALWFGEGDLPTPSFICDGASRAMAEGHTFYTWQRGIPPLRDALSSYLGRLHAQPVPVDRITVTTSGMAAIMITMTALVGPGDGVAVVSPVWPNVFAAAEIAGARVTSIPAEREPSGHWTLDLDRLFAACDADPSIKAIFLNSPCNPTGWVCPAADIARLLDYARRRGLWIIADEVYGRFTYDTVSGSPAATAPSFLDIADPEDRLIVVNTFSKNWCMTGWRIGWMVTPASLGPTLEKLVQFSTSGTAPFLQYGALTALCDGEDFFQDLLARCAAARHTVVDTLAGLPSVDLAAPMGGFYAFFRVAGEPDSARLAKRLIDDAGVGLAPGVAFGPGGEDYLRLCFAGSPDLVARATKRLADALS